MKTSIIIATHNHCDDYLLPCLESIHKYTSLTDREVIVVANGCTDNTRQALPDWVKTIWVDEPMGFIKATNEGIKAATGEFLVLLNNDVVLLPQRVDEWLEILERPFADSDTGITGPVKFHWNCGGIRRTAIAFWCAMIRREVIEKVGLLDEEFSPGMGEDGDFSIKAEMAGYKLVQVPIDVGNIFGEKIPQELQRFPIYHAGNGTFGSISEKEAIQARNDKILVERYGRKLDASQKYDKEISIVIPTYNHCSDLLKPCIESLVQYTDISNMEIIIVANGCIDETKEYVEGLGDPFKLIWMEEKLGYTKATNIGIKAAVGEYVILLNNDNIFLKQRKNQWLDQLQAPFLTDPLAGITGPLVLHDGYADEDALIFFCVMMRRSLFDEIGYLDEIYSPGGGEDIDFSVRCRRAGYKTILTNNLITTNVGDFPLYHIAEGTFSDKEHPEYGNYIIKEHGVINMKRYNKHIRLNLGSGGIEVPGFLSVDSMDRRAHILRDVTKLELDDNSVEEMIASHLFEHLDPYRSVDILKDWFRMLKPGGRLVMEMPNIAELCRHFEKADKTQRYMILNAIYGSINTITGEQNVQSPHLFGWYPEIMADHLNAAGFVNIRFMPEQIPHPGYNFRVECNKP